MKLLHLDWNLTSALGSRSCENWTSRVHARSKDWSKSRPRQLYRGNTKSKACHETKIQIWFRMFFKAQNQDYNDWSAFEKSPSKKSSRKSQKRKTSFSINAIKSGFLPKRKSSRTISHDNHAFDEERSSVRNGFQRSRPSIPTDRDSVLNANLRNSILPILSNRLSDKPNDPNFAWID